MDTKRVTDASSCEHALAHGALCIHCQELMTVAAYVPGDEPNRTYYESYWVGPREAHAWCDPFGEFPRIEDEDGYCLSPRCEHE